MYKLRWSNGYSYAVEFAANDQSLAGEMARALEEFQRARAKHYHDGEAHRNLVHFPTAELHIGSGDGWFNPGRIESAAGLAYFQPRPFATRGAVVADDPATITTHFDQLAFGLLIHVPELLRCFDDVRRWSAAFENFVLDVAQQIGETLGEEPQ
jgi:hypothetical protein